MWSEPRSPTFLVVIAASIFAHVAILAILPPADPAVTDAPTPPVFVTVEAAPLPTDTAPPPPPPATLPPIVAARQPVARGPRPAMHTLAAPRPTVAAAEPRPAAAAEPADLSGVTLTNEDAAWSSPVGDGSPLTGPIAATGSTPVQHGPAGNTGTPGTPGTPGTGDRVVALGDLSRPPRAPDLNAQLAANYPRDARLAGIPGSAVIRARILVNGRVGATRVVSESAPGFGRACQHTLAGSRWQPPLDAHQQAVATDLAYTCTFAVAR